MTARNGGKKAQRGTSAATLAVVSRPRGWFQPYGRNPVKNDGAVDRMAGLIREFGFRIPMLARSSGEVIDGHLRLKAAGVIELDKLPVILCDDWTEAQVKAFRLASRNSAAWAEWDDALVALELGDLKEFGFDLALTGFDEADLRKRLGLNGAVEDTPAPPVPENPASRLGELYELGRHRLLCGDATAAPDVERLLAGAKPTLMVTDPPYGVDYDPDWRNRADRANGKPYGARAVGLVENDGLADWTAAWALFPGDVVYCWHADRHASTVQASLERAGFEIRSQIIWAKSRLIISRGHYHWQHEPCWYAFRKGASAGWIGDRSQTTLWEIEHVKSETGHGTQKPIEAMRRPIQNHAGDVYDPFLGSGTTLIAAEMMGRTCYGLEISPGYCDVIRRRYAEFVGRPELIP